MSSTLHPMLNVAIRAARAAGAIINRAALDIESVRISQKQVNDFVTEIDHASEDAIIDTLLTAYPHHGMHAEESGTTRGNPKADHVWIIDPLDGTKEFIKRNGEFTVNIALIENGKPTLGVVYAPVMKVMYSAEKGKAWKEECGVRKQIQVRDARPPLVVISRSHGNDPELQEYLEQLGEHQTTSIGSSLKFCLVAEGQAQLYPRFGPTSTWDTAAGHAVAVAAGAHVHDWQGKTLDYTPRESFLNPGFRVSIY